MPRYLIGGGLIALFIALVFAYRVLFPAPFEFTDITNLHGFRTLAASGKTTRFVPLVGSLSSIRTVPPDTGAICKALYQDTASPSVGAPNSPVLIVEFFDYRCPFCKVLAKILPGIQSETNTRLIYKEWPTLGEPSLLAARAALAAHNQGRYQAFHEKLMAAGFLPTPEYLDDLGKRVGLNMARLKRDLAAPEITETLNRNHALAQDLGLVGTPAMVVGRTIVQGAITRDQLLRLIALEKSLPPICPS